jgi:hypothetical protein
MRKEKVIPTKSLFRDDWNPDECHRALTGTCSLDKKFVLTDDLREESDSAYCQQLYLAMLIAQDIDKIHIPYNPKWSKEENGAIEFGDYLSKIKAVLSDFNERNHMLYVGELTKKNHKELLETADKIGKVVRTKLQEYFPSAFIPTDIFRKYVRLSFRLSKHAGKYELPVGNDSNSVLSDGHHRSCVAYRGRISHMWIHMYEDQDFIEY